MPTLSGRQAGIADELDLTKNQTPAQLEATEDGLENGITER